MAVTPATTTRSGVRRHEQALHVVRVAAAGTMFIHGVARVSLGIVGDFGGFFAAQGFPAGVALAWLVTIVEIVGGGLLLAGFLVRPLSLYFIAQLLAGIALIHVHHGWFTVGAGRNGMEFSAVLILAFAAVAWAGRIGPLHRAFGRQPGSTYSTVPQQPVDQ